MSVDVSLAEQIVVDMGELRSLVGKEIFDRLAKSHDLAGADLYDLFAWYLPAVSAAGTQDDPIRLQLSGRGIVFMTALQTYCLDQGVIDADWLAAHTYEIDGIDIESRGARQVSEYQD